MTTRTKVTGALLVVALFVFLFVSSFSGGLSDAERAWCDSNGPKVHAASADLDHPAPRPGASERSPLLGGYVYEGVVYDDWQQAMEAWHSHSSGPYRQACKAAYDNR